MTEIVPRRSSAGCEPEHFRNPSHRALFEAIEEADGDIAAIAGGEDPKLAAAVSSLAVEPLDGEPTPSTRAACGRDCRSSC